MIVVVQCLVQYALVTDDEKGFFEAIDFHLPNIRIFLHWNHASNAVKFWLRKHDATASEVPVYISDMHTFSHCSEFNLLEKLKYVM